jgi:hypothetical protein
MRPPLRCLWAAAALVVALGSASCRSPTEITVSVTTDIDCSKLQGTSIAVGSADSLASTLPSATTLTCDGGNIGTLVVVPSGGGNPDIAIRVVTGVSESPDACDKDGYTGGCIVARRSLHFIAHTSLTVPVVMRSDCENVQCNAAGPLSTCVQGQCVPASIPDPGSCEGSGCGEGVLSDAGAGDDAGGADAGDGSIAFDATREATAGGGASTMVLLGLGSTGAYGVAYSGGAWGSPAPLWASPQFVGGGGVTYLSDGRALAVGGQGYIAPQGSGAIATLFAGGSWGAPSMVAGGVGLSVSAPLASATGALVARSDTNSNVLVDTFTGNTSAWTTQGTGLVTGSPPTIAATGTGNPIVLVDITPATGTTVYDFTVLSGSSWSAPTAVPGVATLSNSTAASAAALRSGIDQIVAVFKVGNGTGMQWATYSGGAWSAGQTIVNDLNKNQGVFSLAPLSDGRMWLAYVNTSNIVQVSSFNGSAWSAFRSVPGVTTSAYGYYPVSLTHGVGGHVVELAFIDSSGKIQWTSLTDESKWAWSTPVVVANSTSYGFVSIAAP